MTTDLEKQFFDTFGIEADQWCKIGINKDGNFYQEPTDKRYPQITDTHYLKLHCLLNSIDQPPYGQNVEELKKDILICSIGIFGKNETTTFFEDFKHQVQALF